MICERSLIGEKLLNPLQNSYSDLKYALLDLSYHCSALVPAFVFFMNRAVQGKGALWGRTR